MPPEHAGERLVIRAEVTRILVAAIGGGLFLLVTALWLANEESGDAGPMAVCLVSAVLIGAVGIVVAQSRVVLTPSGITLHDRLHRFTTQHYRWQEIHSIQRTNMGFAAAAMLILRDGREVHLPAPYRMSHVPSSRFGRELAIVQQWHLRCTQ